MSEAFANTTIDNAGSAGPAFELVAGRGPTQASAPPSTALEGSYFRTDVSSWKDLAYELAEQVGFIAFIGVLGGIAGGTSGGIENAAMGTAVGLMGALAVAANNEYTSMVMNNIIPEEATYVFPMDEANKEKQKRAFLENAM